MHYRSQQSQQVSANNEYGIHIYMSDISLRMNTHVCSKVYTGRHVYRYGYCVIVWVTLYTAPAWELFFSKLPRPKKQIDQVIIEKAPQEKKISWLLLWIYSVRLASIPVAEREATKGSTIEARSDALQLRAHKSNTAPDRCQMWGREQWLVSVGIDYLHCKNKPSSCALFDWFKRCKIK